MPKKSTMKRKLSATDGSPESIGTKRCRIKKSVTDHSEESSGYVWDKETTVSEMRMIQESLGSLSGEEEEDTKLQLQIFQLFVNELIDDWSEEAFESRKSVIEMEMAAVVFEAQLLTAGLLRHVGCLNAKALIEATEKLYAPHDGVCGEKEVSRVEKWREMLQKGKGPRWRAVFSKEDVATVPQLAEETYTALQGMTLCDGKWEHAIVIPCQLAKSQQGFLKKLCQLFTLSHILASPQDIEASLHEFD